VAKRPSKSRPPPSATRTLDELDQRSAPELARRPPPRPVREARAVRLQDLTPQQLLALLHDGRGLPYLLPLAVKTAARDPWADVEFHRGDLLLAILHTRPALWPGGTRLRTSMVALARAAVTRAAALPAARRNPAVEAEVERWLAGLS